MSRSPIPSRTPSSDPWSRNWTRRGYRKAYWIALGVSAAIHLFAIFLYPSLLQEIPAGVFTVGGADTPVTPQGMELLNLQEFPEEEDVVEVLPPEEEPEPDPVLPTTPVPVARPGAGEPGAEGEEEDREALPTAAERLQPPEGDLRLWAPIDPELNQLTREEVMRLRLLSVLENMADSAAVAEELARQARDWTYTDDEGRKWGFSPGRIHLGDVTLPNPFNFGVKGADLERVWEWDQIERGAVRGSVMESWKERDEAIRRRMNAQRRPDTTGVRR